MLKVMFLLGHGSVERMESALMKGPIARLHSSTKLRRNNIAYGS
jgi:hypothetical protein